MTTFILTLVRHGRTEANDLGIIQGHSDTKLNATGILQAQILSLQLKVHEYQLVYSSDLKRAYQTAEELVRSGGGGSNGHTVKTIHADDRLRERTLGTLDGQHGSLFREQCKKVQLDPDDHTPAEGETLQMLQKRVYDFLEHRLLPEATSLLLLANPAKILLVSHGVTIREIIKYFHTFGHESWNAVDYRKFNPKSDIPPNTSVSEFKVHLEEEEEEEGEEGEEGEEDVSRVKIKTVEVVRLHDVSHLQGEMRHKALNHFKHW